MKRPERDPGFTLEAGLWPDELVFDAAPREGEIPEREMPRPALAEQGAPGEAEERSAAHAEMPVPVSDPELGGVVAMASGDGEAAAEGEPLAEEPAPPVAEARRQAQGAPPEPAPEPMQPAKRIRILDELFPPAYAGVPVQ